MILCALLAGLVTPGRTYADPSSNHLIMINEIYTNADGTKQFIELIAMSEGQTELAPTHIDALNADASDTNLVYDFTTFFPQLGLNETILLATQAAVNELLFNPDRVIPSNSIHFANGRVLFDRDVGLPIDAVAFGNYTGETSGFGTPAQALPTNGVQSLQRIRYSFVSPNNSTDFVYATNSPKRNDGVTGSLQGDPAAPVLAPIGAKGVEEGQLLSFGISASDVNGTTPTLTAVGYAVGASFVNHQNGTGTFSWTPTYTQAGIDTVLFIASDGTLADSEGVEMTVVEVTDPPVARDSAATTAEDSPFSAQLQAYDPDGDTIIFSIQSGPFKGQVSSLDTLTGSFLYTPNSNVSGPDSLTFRVFDRNAYSNSAKWRLTISPLNDPPLASNLAVSTIVNYSLSVGAMPVTDVDNSSWTIDHRAGPFHGTVSSFVAASGSFTYTPVTDYVGPDSITYRASDGTDTSAHARVRIQVYADCGCPCPGDPVCDGVRCDILDVVQTVGVAFRGTPPDTDPPCPSERTDVDCSGSTDILDVVKVVNVAFRGVSLATEFCNPCAP